MEEVRPDRSVLSSLQKELPRGDDIPALDRPKLSTEIVLSDGDGSEIGNQGRKAISDWVATLFIHIESGKLRISHALIQTKKKAEESP